MPDKEEIAQSRRQELWEMLMDGAAHICNTFSWAIPDKRSLRILAHFSPIIEIGAGAGVYLWPNQHWSPLMSYRSGGQTPGGCTIVITSAVFKDSIPLVSAKSLYLRQRCLTPNLLCIKNVPILQKNCCSMLLSPSYMIISSI
jgi:hypothetical protein